jgi:hypothetical protein
MSVCVPPSYPLSANNEKEHGPRIELVRVIYENFATKRDLIPTLVYFAKVDGVINRDYSKKRNGPLEKMFVLFSVLKIFQNCHLTLVSSYKKSFFHTSGFECVAYIVMGDPTIFINLPPC